MFLQLLAEEILGDSLSNIKSSIEKDSTIGAKQLKDSMNSTFSIISNLIHLNKVCLSF